MEYERTDKQPHSGNWLRTLSLRRPKHVPRSCVSEASNSPNPIFDDSSTQTSNHDDHFGASSAFIGPSKYGPSKARPGELDSDRDLSIKDIARLKDMRLTSDSESGIGIEFRDQSDGGAQMDLPLVRRGQYCLNL